MLRILVTASLLFTVSAIAGGRLTSEDFIRCTAAMEHASLKLLLDREPTKEYALQATHCPGKNMKDDTGGLSTPQLVQYRKVLGLYLTQMQTPTETVHRRLEAEIATFVEMLN